MGSRASPRHRGKALPVLAPDTKTHQRVSVSPQKRCEWPLSFSALANQVRQPIAPFRIEPLESPDFCARSEMLYRRVAAAMA